MGVPNFAEFEQMCKGCTEIQLYFYIYRLGGYIWSVNHELSDGRMLESPEIKASLEEAQRKVEIAVDQTERFGVKQPRNEDGGATIEYWRWFRWWDGYINGLSPAKQERLVEAIDQGKNVSRWRPKTDWRKEAV
jgi:hypothetical protein